VNAELLHAAGLIGSLRRPVKVLGGGEVGRPLFVVADAFTATARAKIEAAGGTAQVLEPPTEDRVEAGPAPAAGAKPAEPVAEPEADAVTEPEPRAVAESTTAQSEPTTDQPAAEAE
jgi:hypothetical protein